jgi:hypothetical protein
MMFLGIYSTIFGAPVLCFRTRRSLESRLMALNTVLPPLISPLHRMERG